MTMKLGVTLRNMGPESTPEIMLAGARAAEERGFESLWITDHIAIPPDDAEGSGGRYTDPLTTLAWLGAATRTLRLGTGVLNLPYRPALPTAKQIATVQELTGNRLLLGVGLGWMDAEFRALGVDRRQRGAITDATLALLRDCFSNDVVSSHGQPYIFSPRPVAPPVYIGGSAPHALQRALRHGHGWLPMARDPAVLERELAGFRELAAAQGREPGPVTVLAGVPLDAADRTQDAIRAYAGLGIERLVCALRYRSLDEYLARLDLLAAAHFR